MKTISIILLNVMFLGASANATSVEEKSLKQLVLMSGTILGGQVVEVRMTDGKGRAITDSAAMTGPGLDNTIFFDVVVDPALILRTGRAEVPARISIPLWQMWHYSLGDLKLVEGSKSIFLLTDDFEPAYPAGFQRRLEVEQKIRDVMRRSRRRESNSQVE